MNESSRPVALVALAVCGAALGATVYLGTTPGPSKAGSASSVSGTANPSAPSPSAASPSPSVPSPPAMPSAYAQPASDAPPTGFVPSPELTPEEQTVLERLNEVRANPPAFLPMWRKALPLAMKHGGCQEAPSMLDDLATYEPRQPLAPNQALTIAARKHAADMLARNFVAHTNPDGVGPNQRVIDAGYRLPVNTAIHGGSYEYSKSAGNIESLALRGGSPPPTWSGDDWAGLVDQLVVDACVPSRGHRVHVLGRDGIRIYEYEVGIGGAAGVVMDGDRQLGKMLLAIEIALRNNDVRFVTGVAYRDKNGNKKYDLGEGVPDIEVTRGDVSTKTTAGGGYVLPVMKSTKGELTAAGATRPADVADQNIKIDIIVN